MLNYVKIERFRGIQRLDLEDLGKVNIFIGTNAGGKTSVLEAISILANPNAAPWLVTLSKWREMKNPTRQNDDALRSYFYDLDISETPRLETCVDGKVASISIAADAGQVFVTSQAEDSPDQQSAVAETQRVMTNLSLVYEEEGRPPARSVLEVQELGFKATAAKVASRVGAFHIHARRATSPGETARLLTSLYETKREGELLRILQNVDPRIVRLWPGVRDVGPTILVDVGLPHMLPMNVMGDGFCRVLLMATGLLFASSQLLIVDEIDSGLHYTVMQPLWRGLASLGDSKQVFCATHDDEMLKATLDVFAEQPDALRIFRLDRGSDNQVTATKYSYDTFLNSAKASLEVR